jgi:hypothetical protein
MFTGRHGMVCHGVCHGCPALALRDSSPHSTTQGYLMKMLNALFVLHVVCILSVSVSFGQDRVEQWGRFEAALTYAASGNPFHDVRVSAAFVHKDTSVQIAGFYDGNNTFKIRFMPQRLGQWNYSTSSNVPGLDNIGGTFECIPATGNNHGMVRVSGTYNFAYADGKPFSPFGTTAYAWTHMSDGVQEMTLATLAKAGFNKVRMCVFPKDYNLVKEEPALYPFAIQEVTKDALGKDVKVWDFGRFNPAFFQHLERRIDDLNRLGIEADLILFHPYDKGRWGFDAMPREVNLHYIKYLTARLSSFRNVWWSIANEFDYVKAKTRADWDELSRTVVDSDPYRHLCSIHGSTAHYYEYWKPEFTHASIQDEAPVQHWGGAAILRNAYFKPVVYDEVGYEGNLVQRWGRYSGEEMLYVVWMGVIAGTYVTHGESYMFKNERDTIFWAKGGDFKGTSWKRIAFLRKLVEECPGPLELADISRDHRTATAGKGTYIIYFGKDMNDAWLFDLPHKNGTHERPKPGARFKVDIIDTWDMTVQPYPEVFEVTSVINYRLYDKDFRKVRLPLKPYMALRISEAP